MLVTESLYCRHFRFVADFNVLNFGFLIQFLKFFFGRQHLKIGHQHISSPTSVINIRHQHLSSTPM